jgi:hypothetical protein
MGQAERPYRTGVGVNHDPREVERGASDDEVGVSITPPYITRARTPHLITPLFFARESHREQSFRGAH